MRFCPLLAEAVAARRRANPRCSLRACARWLGLDHATLSQLLRGVRRATPRSIAQLGARIALDPETIAACVAAETDALVLAVISRPGYEPSSRWVAVRAGLPVDEVNIALHRLLRRGALRMPERGRWRVVEERSA